MGKRKLWTGIIIGASIGGIASLFCKDTRNYVKESSEKVSDCAAGFVNNPVDGIQKVKQSVATVQQLVSTNADSAVQAIDQVENTLQKFLK